MALIEHQTTIAAPIERVYRVSQDYAGRYDWDPFPEHIELVAGPAGETARGTQVDIQSRLGMAMRVEFVQVQPPTRAAVKMVQGPWFLEKFAGSWVFQALSEDSTAARFRYHFNAGPGLLRPLIEPLAALYFSRVVAKRLAGLKAFCERPPGLGGPANPDAMGRP